MKTNQNQGVRYETPHLRQIVVECENLLCTSSFSEKEGIEETLFGDPTDY